MQYRSDNYTKPVLLLIALLSAYRALLAFVMELGNDETYYWLYSQQLQWNYFDHPPGVAIWIRLFTANLLLDDYEGFIRLGSVVGASVSSWFIFKTVALIHSEKAGWYAVILYNASFYASVTAGIYILPDSPQMVVWTFSLWMLAKIIDDDRKYLHWILFGIGAGLSIMCKVHAGFLWIGFGLFILFNKRAWLARPQFYLSVLLTAIIISPIFIWNYQYDFVTWNYHSERVDVDVWKLNWWSFVKQFASQVGFNNPINFVLVIMAALGWKSIPKKHRGILSIFGITGGLLAFSLLVVSFFRDTTLPHWSGPAFVTLIPMAAIYLAEKKRSFFPPVLRSSLAVFLLIYTGWAIVLQYYPGTFSRDTDNLGKGDITADMFGWEDAGHQFSAIREKDISEGLMPEGAPMVTSHWWGAHVEYYFCRPVDMVMIGLGTKKTGHYLWLNASRSRNVNMEQAYCVVPSTDRYRIPYEHYKQIELSRVIDVNRNGRPAHRFFVYRLKGFKGKVPAK